jgi:hypothetical protein
MHTNSSKAEGFLEILVEPVSPQKGVANLCTKRAALEDLEEIVDGEAKLNRSCCNRKNYFFNFDLQCRQFTIFTVSQTQ